ncbi:hypothetical protein [Amycolatopsis sp. cmx-4-54]|uniref:hypothetical protein n=1 Tax=Amycolatopsis sp. cmx-4-54 TaxID=2790936 RepID=UPI00397D026C
MTIAPLAPTSRHVPKQWSPGPGYDELLTARAWTRRLGSDEYEVVIVTGVGEDGHGPALTSGVLSETLVSLADYWLDNPAELRLLVSAGLLQRHDISPEHPALARATAPDRPGTPPFAAPLFAPR